MAVHLDDFRVEGDDLGDLVVDRLDEGVLREVGNFTCM